MKTIGVVLAGGESRRFGQNKLDVVVNGRPMLSHAVEVLEEAVGDVRVSVAAHDAGPKANYRGHPTIVDEIPGIGPISGLLSAFRATPADWIVLLAGDMPCITATSIRSLLAAKNDRVKAVVAVDASDRAHPLVASYHRSTVPDIEFCIDRRSYAMKSLLSRIGNVEYITLPEADLTNVNRPADLPE